MICEAKLTVAVNGEFWCESCERYYLDCDTLKYATKAVQPGLREPRSEQHLHSRQLCYAEPVGLSSDGEEYKHEVGDLKNIDLRIVHRETT